jgi:serine/threonine protein kinase/formylglycine-generating enzyme required for sulfatase activity
MQDLIGKILGQYRIIEKIGSGGMADVYIARQESLNRHVAVKVLPAILSRDKTFRARFEREARSVAQLRHPNILTIFDYGKYGDVIYIVMEYARGSTLKERMTEPIPLERAVEIISQVGSALAYAHRQGVIHRDVKPSNVLLTEDGWPLLADFGLARMVEGSKELTVSGVSIGTPEYMSPEQGRGLSADHRTDIYSLGVMLYEMVTGQRPYSADTPMAVIIKHMSAPLPSPLALRPDLPVAMEGVIIRAMAKAPQDRYETAEDMVAALQVVLREAREGQGEASEEKEELPDSVVLPLAKTSSLFWRKKRFPIWAVLAVLVLLIGGGGALAWGLIPGFSDAVSPRFTTPTAMATRTSESPTTSTSTSVPTSTATPTLAPTATPTPTMQGLVTATPADTPTPVPTATTTPTSTPTVTSPPTQTPTPTATSLVAPTPGPAFTIVGVGTGPCSDFKEVFDADVGPLYGCFEYALMRPGMTWSWGFYLNGKQKFGGLEAWTRNEEGQTCRSYRPTSGFAVGEWEFRVVLESQPRQSKRFWVGVTPTSTTTAMPMGSPTPKATSSSTATPTPQAPTGMVWIPAGTFSMGASDDDVTWVNNICQRPSFRWTCPDFKKEQPQRQVEVAGFWMDRDEVTNRQFEDFVTATGHQTDAEKRGEAQNWRTLYTSDKRDHPVMVVSWNDANAYCQWLGKRLPTEAEWEKAARGTEGYLWPWGDFWDAARVNSTESGINGTYAVGARGGELGQSPYGVNDMAGNVWEWTADWWGWYENPHRPPESNQEGWGKVIRGGSWRKQGYETRTTFRGRADPSGYSDDMGFRCAK